MNNHYNKSLRSYARENRKNPTPAERLLWKHLRKRQLNGSRFLRQRPINNYIVDFFCPEFNLIIEINGSSHDELKFEYDEKKRLRLKNLGYKVLDFPEGFVIKYLNYVLEEIYRNLIRRL